MMSAGSMPGPAADTAAPAPSLLGPQHAQLQQQHPANAYSNNSHNTSNGHVVASASSATPLQLPARDWSMMTRTIAHYERLEQIGEGTYGQVYKARCKDTGQIVALKKIRVHHGKDWGMPPTVIREIKILKRLQHPSLVRMMEVVSSKGVEHLDEEDESTDIRFQKKSKDRIVDAREGYKGNLFLVLEYVSHDLTGLMDIAYQFTPVQVKSIFKQLLEALDYMHQNKYVHRDIKSSNILLDHHFRVKLADFGLARCIEPPILDNLHDRASSQEFTNKVITLWYRPPEILLGATKYGPPVDVWSAGCILAELLIGKPLFTGKTEMDQLQLIFDLLGTPSPETWDGLTDLKLLRTGQVSLPSDQKHRKEPRLRTKYSKKVPPSAMGLLEKLLELDPMKRLTAERALTNRYFLSEPIAPKNPEDLGPVQVKDHFHEFQTKRKRRQAKAEAEKSREAAKAAGMDDEQAQEQFDSCYRKLMKKVQTEGIDAFGSSSRDKSSSGANRKDKYKDKQDRDRNNDSVRDDKRDSKKSDRNRDRVRPEEDRRKKDSDSRKRDSEHRRQDDGDSSRRKRRKEHEEKDSDAHTAKEPRPSGEEGEEKADGERKASRRDKDRSSRERRSSRDRDKDRRRDKDRDRRKDGESRRESEKSRHDPEDDSRSSRKRQRRESDADRHKSNSSNHRRPSEGEKDREKGRMEGTEVTSRGDRKSAEGDKEREKGRRERGDRGKSREKTGAGFDHQDTRRHDDRRRERGDRDKSRDAKHREPRHGRDERGHDRGGMPGGERGGHDRGPRRDDRPPHFRDGPPPRDTGHYGPLGLGPARGPGGGGPPHRRDDRDGPRDGPRDRDRSPRRDKDRNHGRNKDRDHGRNHGKKR